MLQLKCAPPYHAVKKTIPIGLFRVSAHRHGPSQHPIWRGQLKTWPQPLTPRLRFQVLPYMSLPHLLVKDAQLVSSYLKIALSLPKPEIAVLIFNSTYECL